MNTPSISIKSFRNNIPKAIPFLLLLIIYAPALLELVEDWYLDSNYSHGFLIPLVSLYMIWSKREELAAIPSSISPSGLVLVIVGIVMFIVGNSASEYFTVRLSFVIILIGLVRYLFGRQIMEKIWFELTFLIFMIPIPYVIYYTATFPLQLLASKITATILTFIGLDIVRQGNILHIPGYSLEVAEACSGMRSIVSLLALGALYAQMTQPNTARKIILFLSTIPLAIAANVFRVFVTTILAAVVGDEVAQEPLHSLFGMSVFVVAFTGLFLFGRILLRGKR